MKLAKNIIKVVWPIIYSKLAEMAQKTTTPFDDYAVAGINTAIQEWLQDDSDE